MGKPLSAAEAAEFLGLKLSYVYKLCHLGKIPYYKPTGGRTYFLEEDLLAFLLRGRRSADYELLDRADGKITGRAKQKKGGK